MATTARTANQLPDMLDILTLHTTPQHMPLWSDARNRIASHYQHLVARTIINIYTPAIRWKPEWEELHQEGNIGLLKAVERIHPERLDTFPAYAEKYIRKQVVAVWHRNNQLVKLPRARGELVGRISKCRNLNGDLLPLSDIIGLLPDDDAAAIRDAYMIMTATSTSVDSVVEDGRPAFTVPVPSVETIIDDTLRGEVLAEVVDTLPVEERDVLRYRFGFTTGHPESLATTADALNITVRRAKELEHTGFARLAHESRRAKLYL